MQVACLLFGSHGCLPQRLGAALAEEGCAVEAVAEAGAFRSGIVSGYYSLGFLRHAWPSEAEVLRVLRDLRRACAIPCVLVGAAPLPAAERVAALDAGADEILDGAIPLAEAVARVRAVLRRSGPAAAAPALSRATDGWRLSPGTRSMRGPDGGRQRLTAAEFDLLRLLAAASGRAVDRDAISREAFRRPWRPEDRAVDGLVKRLRRKLGPDSILTSRGLGYALTIQVHSE